MFKIISHQGNSNRNHTKICQLGWQKLTRQQTTIGGENVEKGDPSYIVAENAFGTAILENSVDVP